MILNKNNKTNFLFLICVFSNINIYLSQKNINHKNGFNVLKSKSIKCSDFYDNCRICNITHCNLCKTGFIFANGNFLKCIPKESINLDFYITNDNQSYYSCQIDEYKNLEKCKVLLSNKDIIDNPFILKEKENLEPNMTKLQEICHELFPEGEPGAAVLIMKDENIIFEEYFGLMTLPKGPKTDKSTRFNIASVSKQFTAVAVLRLVAEGKVSLEAPVGQYFSEYNNSLWKKVKVKHLLSHSSGIPDDREYLTTEQKINGDENLALEYFQWLNHLHFEPGTAYEYINPTYVLLGRLIEKISGKNFTNYMQEHIFKPANMTKTAYIGQEQNAAHAYEYSREGGDSEESGDDRPDGPHDWYEFDYGEENFFGTRPDGGIYTTPRDFVKWELTLPSLLPKSLLQETFQPHTYVSGSNWSDYQNRPDTWYGYGWFIEPKKQCIYHTGDNGGFKILASRYPQNNTLVLAFAARADWDRYGLKTKIEQILHLTSNIKSKVIFIRQIQMINKVLKVFIIINFAISKNEVFKFQVIINKNNLEKNEEKDIELISSEDYDGKGDKIIEITSKEEFEKDSVVSLQTPKNNYDIKIILNDNKNNLDTENAKTEIKNGGIDYNNIPSNYKIYHYSINYATNGCDFSLNSLENIKENDKNINLNFIEVDSDDIINVKCKLSHDNGNNITCKLDKNIDKNYILEPYIYSDNSETLIISQDDINNYLILKCSVSQPPSNKNNSSMLSRGKILGIIFGIFGVFTIGVITYYIIKKYKNRKEEENINLPLIKD